MRRPLNVRLRAGRTNLIYPEVHAQDPGPAHQTLCGIGMGYDGPDVETRDPVTCWLCLKWKKEAVAEAKAGPYQPRRMLQ